MFRDRGHQEARTQAAEFSDTEEPRVPACRATKLSRRPQGRGVGVDRGALRWPWGGGSGEAQLRLGSGGREGWGLGAEAQMVEDPARDERVGEGGDVVAAAAARGEAQHVDREGQLEEFGPANASLDLLSSLDGLARSGLGDRGHGQEREEKSGERRTMRSCGAGPIDGGPSIMDPWDLLRPAAASTGSRSRMRYHSAFRQRAS